MRFSCRAGSGTRGASTAGWSSQSTTRPAALGNSDRSRHRRHRLPGRHRRHPLPGSLARRRRTALPRASSAVANLRLVRSRLARRGRSAAHEFGPAMRVVHTQPACPIRVLNDACRRATIGACSTHAVSEADPRRRGAVPAQDPTTPTALHEALALASALELGDDLDPFTRARARRGGGDACRDAREAVTFGAFDIALVASGNAAPLRVADAGLAEHLGVGVPRSSHVTRPEQVADALEIVGLPAVVKPMESWVDSGSARAPPLPRLARRSPRSSASRPRSSGLQERAARGRELPLPGRIVSSRVRARRASNGSTHRRLVGGP